MESREENCKRFERQMRELLSPRKVFCEAVMNGSAPERYAVLHIEDGFTEESIDKSKFSQKNRICPESPLYNLHDSVEEIEEANVLLNSHLDSESRKYFLRNSLKNVRECFDESKKYYHLQETSEEILAENDRNGFHIPVNSRNKEHFLNGRYSKDYLREHSYEETAKYHESDKIEIYENQAYSGPQIRNQVSTISGQIGRRKKSTDDKLDSLHRTDEVKDCQKLDTGALRHSVSVGSNSGPKENESIAINVDFEGTDEMITKSSRNNASVNTLIISTDNDLIIREPNLAVIESISQNRQVPVVEVSKCPLKTQENPEKGSTYETGEKVLKVSKCWSNAPENGTEAGQKVHKSDLEMCDEGSISRRHVGGVSMENGLQIEVECCGKWDCEASEFVCSADKGEKSSVLMRLHLRVQETGQLWRRAFVRMVLDPAKVDYGTLSVAVPAATERMKGQETMYQRQPLLPNQNSSSLVLTIDDSDDDADGLNTMQTLNLPSRQNGRVVNIKLPPPLKEEPRFPKEVCKTVFAFLLMAFSMTLGILILSIVHDSVPNLDVAERNISRPLPDIILDNIPSNDKWALNASEIIIMISFWSCAILIFLHKYRFIVARRVFLIMGLLYLLRCLTMLVTVMPVSSYTYVCSPREEHPTLLLYLQRTWRLLTGFGLSIYGKHTYCGDFIYSGHTTILVMAYLVMSEYSPRKLYPLHWVSWGLSIFGVMCVLVSRGHYTIDVILAYYVSTRVFWIYHTLACNVKLKEWGPHNYLSRVWWFPIFRYFEGNILAPVPRQYDWPLPWPRRFLSRRANRDS